MKNFDMTETVHGYVVVIAGDGPLTTAAWSDGEIDYQFDSLIGELNHLRTKMKSASRGPLEFKTIDDANGT